MSAVFASKGMAGVLREAVRGTGWATKQGTLSRVTDGLALHVYEFADFLRFRAKPVRWDRIFWNVLGIAVKEQPVPTRHFWGANCPTATLEVHRVLAKDATAAASETLGFADRAASRWTEAKARQSSTVARHGPEHASDFVMTEVVIALEAGDHDEARVICQEAMSGQRRVRYLAHNANQSFFEAAISALDGNKRIT